MASASSFSPAPQQELGDSGDKDVGSNLTSSGVTAQADTAVRVGSPCSVEWPLGSCPYPQSEPGQSDMPGSFI